jgi:hypothetical protein
MIWRFNQMRNYRIALHLAKARIATFNQLPIASLPAVGTIAYPDASYPGFTINQVTTTAYNTAGPPNYFVRQIRIQVSTQKDGTLVDIYTYRTNAAAFGDGKIGNTDGI